MPTVSNMVCKRLALVLALVIARLPLPITYTVTRTTRAVLLIGMCLPAGRGYEVLNCKAKLQVVPRQLSSSELNDKDLVERLKRGAEWSAHDEPSGTLLALQHC